jgi:hypothetical protein
MAGVAVIACGSISDAQANAAGLGSEVEKKQLCESVLLKDCRSVFPEERVIITGKSAGTPIALRAQLRRIRMAAPRTLKELKAPLA